MFGLFVLVFCGVTVLGIGDQRLSAPYTCTTRTTLCQPGDARETHISLDSDSSIGRPGKRGFPGPKGEKGDSCSCSGGGGEGTHALPTPTQAAIARESVKGEKGEPGQPQAANVQEMEEVQRRLEKLEAEVLHPKDLTSMATSGRLPRFPTKCSDLRQSDDVDIERAVIYPLISFHDITPYIVNCSDGGRITIQRRINGTQGFYRPWRDYTIGFGKKDGEFWLGLKNIHRLTTLRAYELHIDVKIRTNGHFKYARYGHFFVDDELAGFRLVVGDYSGDYSDRLSYHNGLRFSTYDKDFDEHSSHCAQTNKGAWWYKSCDYSNLNGQYAGNYFRWGTYVTFSEMKIRPRC